MVYIFSQTNRYLIEKILQRHEVIIMSKLKSLRLPDYIIWHLQLICVDKQVKKDLKDDSTLENTVIYQAILEYAQAIKEQMNKDFIDKLIDNLCRNSKIVALSDKKRYLLFDILEELSFSLETYIEFEHKCLTLKDALSCYFYKTNSTKSSTTTYFQEDDEPTSISTFTPSSLFFLQKRVLKRVLDNYRQNTFVQEYSNETIDETVIEELHILLSSGFISYIDSLN